MLSSIGAGLKQCPRSKTAAVGVFRLLTGGGLLTNYGGISRSFGVDVAAVAGQQKPTVERRRERPKYSRVENTGTDKITTPALPHWVQTPVDLAIFRAQNAEDLWRTAAKYELPGTQAVAFFGALAKFADGAEKIVDKSEKELFDRVAASIISDCDTLPIGSKTVALRSLLSLGVSGDKEVIVRLRQELLKSFRLLSPPTLVSFATVHSKYATDTDLGKQLQAAMREFLEKTLQKFTDPNDTLSVLSLVTSQDSTTYKAVENKLLELLPSFSGEQLFRLVNILATKRIRSLPLLKGVANRYVSCEEDLNVKKLASFLADLSSLNFPNMKILSALFRDIQLKLETITKPAIITGIFSSMAIMRLRHVELLEQLCHWTEKRINEFSSEQLISVVIALARCNYTPKAAAIEDDKKSALIGMIMEKVWNDKAKFEKHLWLDFVWSLAVLQRLRKTTAASVLEESFYEPLLKEIGGNDYKLLVTQLKLQNVNTAARIEVQGYAKPLLTIPSHFKDMKEVNVVQYKKESVKLVIDALNNLAPRGKYMKTDVVSPEGYVIDALIHLTESGEPLPVVQWDSSNSQRVAIIVRHFHELTQFTTSPIGLHVMAKRHLNALNYTVLEIPAAEIEQFRQPLFRVEYLKAKLDALVPKRVRGGNQGT